MTNFYVYLYTDPQGNVPFYVGKGKDGRAWDHTRPMALKRSACGKRVEEIKNVGLEPLISFLATGLDEEFAFLIEEEAISLYKRIKDGGTLLNKTSGGQGGSGWQHSDESKKKMSEKAQTPERAEALRKCKSSPEARAKMSKAMQDAATPEYRKTMSSVVKEKWKDPEFRAKMLAARKKK
jgi:hypothetical protein